MTSSVGSTGNPSSDLFASLNGTASSTSSSSTTSSNQLSSSTASFLKLLTAQLQNQDPTNPMDNAQMTSQLAQISTVQGIQQLNTTLQGLITNSSNSQALQAASVVGHGVLVPGDSLVLPSSGSAVDGFDLATNADKVTISIKDGNGNLVRTLNVGSASAGTNTFSWDGTANDGSTAAAGNYTFSVTATQGTNQVTATALAVGLVSSVSLGASGVSLNVGNQTFSMSDVRQII